MDDYGVEVMCSRLSLADLAAATATLSDADRDADSQRVFIEVTRLLWSVAGADLVVF